MGSGVGLSMLGRTQFQCCLAFLLRGASEPEGGDKGVERAHFEVEAAESINLSSDVRAVIAP